MIGGRVKLVLKFIALAICASPNFAWGDEATQRLADEQFAAVGEEVVSCFHKHAALAAKSDLSDSDAAGFVADVCRNAIHDYNYTRCVSGLDGSNPFFAAIYKGAPDPLQLCQDMNNERDFEGVRVEALSQIMQARYE
tara:strand:+ start:1203 stop:1616 length:414 start_codon:yes stop_codon:yes gene_type:complete